MRSPTPLQGSGRPFRSRYWRLVHRQKRSTVAVVAVARELAGFCWSLMTLPA